MTITAIFSYGVVPALLLFFLLTVISLLYFVLRKEEKTITGLKDERYEAGNPPKYKARVRVGFQYLGFFILFASFESVVVTFLLLSLSSGAYINKLAEFFLSIVLVSVPILLYGIKEAEKVENWVWDEE
ncbi:NADH-quinone oxidoreductase subunit A [Fervidicoccus sp.]|uniref:NADH-quinone oxidoreductase subunit A n=1 Tax=Fervidicoccus sp. TaxID=2060324 RepID=UPI003D0A60BE